MHQDYDLADKEQKKGLQRPSSKRHKNHPVVLFLGWMLFLSVVVGVGYHIIRHALRVQVVVTQVAVVVGMVPFIRNW